MADAYTTRGGLIKPEVGQNLNTWGDKLNNNALDSIDAGLFGVANIAVTGDFSLTSANGDATSTQLSKAIRLGGTPAADFAVTFLSKEQCILFHNASGRTATVKVSSGTGVALLNGQKALLGYNSTYGDVTLLSPTRFTGDMVSDGALTIAGQLHGISPGTTGTDGINLNQLNAAIAGLTSVTSPGTIKTSATDTTANYISSKVVGTGIKVSIGSPGGNETLQLGLVNSTADTTPAPLATKLTATGLIARATVSPAGNETSDFHATGYTASGSATYVIAAGAVSKTAFQTSYLVTFTNANAGPATLNDGSGAVALRKNGNQELGPNDIPAGATRLVIYDGTQFQVPVFSPPVHLPIAQAMAA